MTRELAPAHHPPEQHRADRRHDQGDDRQGGADGANDGEHQADYADGTGYASGDDQLIRTPLANLAWCIAAAFLEIGHAMQRIAAVRKV